jgi:hypothetical protein
MAAFIQGLQQLGWTDGQNLRIDVRWWMFVGMPAMPRLARAAMRAEVRIILWIRVSGRWNRGHRAA